jgi:glutathione peroxidase
VSVILFLLAVVHFGRGDEDPGAGENKTSAENKTQEVLFTNCAKSQNGANVYNFSIPLLEDSEKTIHFDEFRGKVLMIVNVATYCGFAIQYPALKALQTQYKDDFVILAFPSNQFALMEPGANATEIMNGIKYVRPGKEFVPNFRMFEKIEVNGENEHELYKYLKGQCAAPVKEYFAKEYLFYKPTADSDIRWNFAKFLIDADGNPYKRFHSKAHPFTIMKDIEELINRKKNPQQQQANPQAITNTAGGQPSQSAPTNNNSSSSPASNNNSTPSSSSGSAGSNNIEGAAANNMDKWPARRFLIRNF